MQKMSNLKQLNLNFIQNIMNFSCLICTRNSERTICDVLYSIINQSAANKILEVIIVDYKSNDTTLKIASDILNTSKLKYRLINCSLPGKSPALELGLDAADGDYVVIIDDDNLLYPNFLEVAKCKVGLKGIGCIGSQGFIDSNLILPNWFESNKSVYAIGLPAEGQTTDWVWGAGSIINRKAWTQLRTSNFHFLLNPGRQSHSEPISVGGEDVELSLAIKLAGFKIISCPELKFIHKIKQDRLSESYLFKSSLGVSRAVTVHELYRTLIENRESRYTKIRWLYKISRKIFGCGVRFAINKASGEDIMAVIAKETLIGIIFGFFQFKSCFKNDYTRLKGLRG